MFVPVNMRLGDTTAYSRAFETLAARAKDLTVPLAAIGALVIRNVGEQFASAGAYQGSPWQPLSDKYAQWKEQHYPGRPLLVRTGQTRSTMLSPGESLTIEPFRLVYEPPSDIAGYHQAGTSRMPARPLVLLPASELHEIDRVFVRWLRGNERGPFWSDIGVRA